MNSSPRWRIALALTLLLTTLSVARAQKQITPDIGFIYPAGGQQGTTFQVNIGGQYLDGVTNALISGHGVRATVIAIRRPLSNKDALLLRDELEALNKKRKESLRGEPGKAKWTDADEKRVTEIRARLADYIPTQQLNRAIAETATLQVTIAPDAEPGERDLRLRSATGLSNPRVFCVGQLSEVTRKLAKVYREPKDYKGPTTAAAEGEITVTLPATVNGQVMPGAVHRWRFKATKGQNLAVIASARGLIPYLPDAVPGWFQATLALYDAKGHELAYDDDFRFNPDPALFYHIPADGEYFVEIKDSIYRGREDFVYRVSISELPFITSIFPLGGPVGKPTTVELHGWNLPVNKLTVGEKTLSAGVVPITVTKDERRSNPATFVTDTLPDTRESEPNNMIDSAQAVTLPIVINGRVDKPGDVDVFRFAGRAGQEIVAEVHARRLNSPLDSVLRLTDDNEHQLAFNDDNEDKGSGLETHHADSYLHFTCPTNGNYFIQLGDTQHKGGPEYAYRLRLSEPRPDFDLRVTPSSLTFRAGASVPVTVFALRKDGFTNAIDLFLADAPAGINLTGGRIPAETNQVRFTLTAPTVAPPGAFNLTIKGRATVHGRELVHTAVPAEDMMQAFAYRHLVPSREFKAMAMNRYSVKAGPKIVSALPVKIPSGGTATLQVELPYEKMADKIHFDLSEPPEGITIKSAEVMRSRIEIILQSDAALAKPGLKGNLIISALASKTSDKSPKDKSPSKRFVIGSLPAVPFEVIAARK